MVSATHDVAAADTGKHPEVACASYSDKCRLRVLPDDVYETLDGRTLCVPCFVTEAASRNTDPERSRVFRRLWETVV